MNHTQITQRVVDAAALILTTAAANTEQTGCPVTSAFATAETRTAETYHLTTKELAMAARLATRAAFATGAYAIGAMADPNIRATALHNAVHHIDTYQLRDQPCSARSESHSPEPGTTPHRPTRPKTSSGSAQHSAPHVSVWRNCANYLSRISTRSIAGRTGRDDRSAAA